MSTASQVLAQFTANGIETCFHGRHINPQIYADLNGSNWRLKAYEARGGYQALRKILGKDGAPAEEGEAAGDSKVSAGMTQDLPTLEGMSSFLRKLSEWTCLCRESTYSQNTAAIFAPAATRLRRGGD